jgi:hypothetical protein
MRERRTVEVDAPLNTYVITPSVAAPGNLTTDLPSSFMANLIILTYLTHTYAMVILKS